MTEPEGLVSDEDEAVLDYVAPENPASDSVSDVKKNGHQPATDVDDERINAVEQAVATMQEQLADMQEQLSTTKRELAETRQELGEERQAKKELVGKLNQLEEAVEGDVTAVGSSTLEKYSTMPEDVREDVLGTTDQRAIKIYNHWDEISWRNAENEWFVDTKSKLTTKNQPSKLKHALKGVLQEDLQWNEVYRAMKAVAKLSGGEEHTDQYGRTHITGGDFEYHVVTTADNSDTRKVLKQVSR